MQGRAPSQTKRSPARWALWSLLVAAVALTAVLGWWRASPPQYCAEGLAARQDPESGARRCCGRGQQLVAGRCAGRPSGCAHGMRVTPTGCVASSSVVPIEGGVLRLDPVDWDSPGRPASGEVRIDPFGIDSHEVMEVDYQACVEAGACAPAELRGEPGIPVTGLARREAERYCRWRGGRLPSVEEHAFAAMGASGRRYPWGDTGAVCRRAAFGLANGPCASSGCGPELAGSRPTGATAAGVHDLAGNVAEWTAESEAGASGVGVVRGGSWRDSTAAALRSSALRVVPAESRTRDIGFRCAFAPAR